MTQIKHGADTNEIKEKYKIDNIIDYSSNVNVFSPEAVEKILSKITSKDLNYYLDINYIELRRKIGSRYNLKEENLIVGNGSTEIMFLIMKLEYIKNVGIINPTFGEYERAANLAGKNVLDFFYEEDFSINLKQIEKDIEKIDILVVCNPNNPSGKINNLEELIILCKKHNKLLMVDETFIEFTGKEKNYTALNYLKTYENLIIIRAVTKFYALTSVRLGYAFSSSKIIRDMWAIKEPWTINIFAEKLADVIYDLKFLEKSQFYYKKEIMRFQKELSNINGIYVYPTDTNFMLIKLSCGKTSSQIKEIMVKKYGILIRDCSNFKGLNDSFIRINIKDSLNNDNFVKCFKDAIYN